MIELTPERMSRCILAIHANAAVNLSLHPNECSVSIDLVFKSCLYQIDRVVMVLQQTLARD